MNRFKRILPLLICGVSLVGGLAVATNASANERVIQPVVRHARVAVADAHAQVGDTQRDQITTPKQQADENYWTNRINRFAAQRRWAHHPSVNFNCRDEGGFRADHGRYRVRSGLLYRSGNLHYVSNRGVRTLNRLHLHHDIDLRYWTGSDVSIKGRPNPGEFRLMRRLPGMRMRYYFDPVETSSQEAWIYSYRVKYGEGYRYQWAYSKNPQAIKAYRHGLRLILWAGKHRIPIMWNCTQGRDRSGVLSYLLLHILGVSERNNTNDFLLTNYYQHKYPYLYQLRLLKIYRNVINRNYGSVSRYIRNVLHITPRQQRQLRREYLVRVR